MVENAKLFLLLVDTQCQMGKDLADTQMALGKVEARVKAVEEVLGEAKNQALAMKEEVWATKVWASKVVEEAVENFKVREEYR